MGTIAVGSADNLGSHALCGFKEGSQAFRGCRQCMATSDEMKEHVSFYTTSLVVNHLHIQMTP